jgi:hypothetical protein
MVLVRSFHSAAAIQSCKIGTHYTLAGAAEQILNSTSKTMSCKEILREIIKQNLCPGLEKRLTPSNSLNAALHFWCKQKRSRFKLISQIGQPHRFKIHPESKFMKTK